jgi:glycerol-3-phosphate O-acyltransferase/dihydroxyacetone phosphate acyltransferase
MQRLLYSVMVAFLTLVTRIFFRSIEVVGREHIPVDGAVIFCGNHPNSLMDPVLITTTCGRRARFAAKDTLFHSAFLRPFLWLLGSVPIKRRMDHASEGTVDNSSAFDALFDVLEHGDAFGIFPEGISHTESEIQPLKTGAARIALGAAEKGVPVRIVPSGLNFRRRDRMRGRVLVQYGRPIEIDASWVARHKSDPKQAARDLTTLIDLALRAQTINAKDFDVLRVMDGVRRLYVPREVSLSIADQAEIIRRLLAHWESMRDQTDVRELYHDVGSYLAVLDALGLEDEDLTRGLSRTQMFLRLVRHMLLLVVFVPVAMPGLILHSPVLVLAVAASNFTDRNDVHATIKMSTLAFATLGTYFAIVVAVFVKSPFPLDWIYAASALIALLLSGWATIRVLERQAVIASGVKTFVRLLDLKRELLRLRDERDALRRRLLAIVDKYTPATMSRVVSRDAQGLADDDV